VELCDGKEEKKAEKKVKKTAERKACDCIPR